MQRVLILESDDRIADSLLEAARNAATLPYATADPLHFIYEASNYQPEHIIIGLRNRGSEGLDVIKLLAQNRCPARVIFTGQMDSKVITAHMRLAYENGLNVVGRLKQPFSPHELRVLLNKNRFARRPAIPELTRPATVNITAQCLGRAIHSDEFIAMLQPQFRCKDGQLTGFEVLARWRHPHHGLLSPEVFIPQLEQHGLMPRFIVSILRQSLAWFRKHAAHWQPISPYATLGHQRPSQAGSQLSLAINVSGYNLADVSFPETLANLCGAHRVPPEQIVLEVTETSTLEEVPDALALLTTLRLKGFQISIDDFGAGYSSLRQLAQLPFSEIKIDRAFVTHVTDSDELQAIVSLAVELGRSLGLRTVAEGVETQETLDFLNSIGCDSAQGFFFAEPMHADDAARWLKQRIAVHRLSNR